MTLSDPTVEGYLRDRFVCVRLLNDAEGVDALAVEGFPTTIVLAADGSELHRFTGFLEPEPFLAELQGNIPAPAVPEGG